MNWMLVFIPATVVVDHLGHAPPALVFFLSALAVVPLAGLLVQATEQISHRTGPAIGGLLNVTFSNAGLVIIFLAVLITGMIASDGKSNWFKGVNSSAYLLIAFCCYFLPNSLELRLDRGLNPMSIAKTVKVFTSQEVGGYGTRVLRSQS
jgi:Ca2+/H+ antiporter